MAWNTFAPDYKADAAALSNGNLTVTVGATGTNGTYYGAGSLEAKCNIGKWHWEITVDTVNGSGYPISIGIVKDDFKTPTFEGDPKSGFDHMLYHSDGQKSGPGDSGSAYGATYTAGDRITVELDLVNNQIEFFKNGSSQGVAFSGATNFRDLPWFPAVILIKDSGGNNVVTGNFGATAFTDTPSSGFVGVDTADITTGYAKLVRTLTESGQGDTSAPFLPCVCNAGTAIRQVTPGGGGKNTVLGSFPKSNGKYYFELTGIGEGGPAGSEATWFGVVNSSFDEDTDDIDTSANAWTFENGSGLANKINNGTTTAYGTAGNPEAETLMVAVDLNAGKIWAGREGTWFASGDPAAGTGEAFSNLSGSNFRIVVDDTYSSTYHVIKLNTGQETFNHTPPSGFGVWDSKTTHTSDGAPKIDISILGGARLPNHYADGAVTATMALSAQATTPTKRANGAVAMTMRVDADATNHAHHCDGNVSMELQLAGSSAVHLPAFVGKLFISPLTMSAEMINQPIFNGEFDLPALTSAGSMLNGQVYNGSMLMPFLTMEAYGPGTGAGVMPALTMSGQIHAGTVANLNRSLPKLRMTGTIASLLEFVGAMSMRKMRMTGEFLTGQVMNAEAPLFICPWGIDGKILVGSVMNGSLLFPTLTFEGSTIMEGLASLSASLPSLYMSGYIVNNQTFVVTSWSINTETLDTTNYTNYDYDKLGTFDGKYFGVAAGGIYLLAGADDAGAAIAASFKTGAEDFGTELLKHMPNAYIGYRSDGAMQFTVDVDGAPATRTYDVERVSATGGDKRARVKVGRGVKSRYWKIGMKNVGGADFEIDEVGALARPLSRKT